MAASGQVVFFIGSGCSFPSGQPSVQEITKRCLDDDYYLLEAVDDTSQFYLGLEDCLPLWGTKRQLTRGSSGPIDLSAWRRPAASIQRLLAYLMSLDLWRVKPNYEDIAGLLNYVASALIQESNDPFVESFIRHTELVSRLEALEFPVGHRYFQYPLARKIVLVESFIGWVIANSIRTSCRLDGYDALLHILHFLEKRGTRYHFVTTNYDCNLERLFRKHCIRYSDGLVFEEAMDSEGHVWEYGYRFRFTDSGVPWLVKLHGSINWYLCQDINFSSNRTLARVAKSLKPTAAFKSYFQAPEGIRFTPIGCPEMLRGSLTKAHEYSYDIYSQLLMGFEKTLDESDLCIVAGFGWADEAIVARLFQFVRTEGKVMLVFDGAEDGPAIGRTSSFTEQMVRTAGNRKSLVLVRKHLSDVQAVECEEYVRDALI